MLFFKLVKAGGNPPEPDAIRGLTHSALPIDVMEAVPQR